MNGVKKVIISHWQVNLMKVLQKILKLMRLRKIHKKRKILKKEKILKKMKIMKMLKTTVNTQREMTVTLLVQEIKR